MSGTALDNNYVLVAQLQKKGGGHLEASLGVAG